MIFHPPQIACGITLPEALQYLAPAIPDRIKTVAQLLGADIPENAGSEEIGQIAYTTVRNLMMILVCLNLKIWLNQKRSWLLQSPKLWTIHPSIFQPGL